MRDCQLFCHWRQFKLCAISKESMRGYVQKVPKRASLGPVEPILQNLTTTVAKIEFHIKRNLKELVSKHHRDENREILWGVFFVTLIKVL